MYFIFKKRKILEKREKMRNPPKTFGCGKSPYERKNSCPPIMMEATPGLSTERMLSPRKTNPIDFWLKNWKIPIDALTTPLTVKAKSVPVRNVLRGTILIAT